MPAINRARRAFEVTDMGMYLLLGYSANSDRYALKSALIGLIRISTSYVNDMRYPFP